MRTYPGGPSPATTEATAKSAKDRARATRRCMAGSEVDGRLHHEDGPGSFELAERGPVVERGAQAGGAGHVVPLDLGQPVGGDVEAQHRRDVVLPVGPAGAI